MGRAGNRCGFFRSRVPPAELRVNRDWSRRDRDTRQEAAKRRNSVTMTRSMLGSQSTGDPCSVPGCGMGSGMNGMCPPCQQGWAGDPAAWHAQFKNCYLRRPAFMLNDDRTNGWPSSGLS